MNELALSASEAERFTQHVLGEFVTVVDTLPTKPCPECIHQADFVAIFGPNWHEGPPHPWADLAELNLVTCTTDGRVPLEPGDVVTINGPCLTCSGHSRYLGTDFNSDLHPSGRVPLGVGTITNIERGEHDVSVCWPNSQGEHEMTCPSLRWRVTLTDVEQVTP